MNRTKIVIIGADASAFHIFHTVYRSDDRFEVASFFNVRINVSESLKWPRNYPKSLCGSSYPNGIPISPVNPFQEMLVNQSIEKCIFSPFCVTSSAYLYLAAQCMAAGCSVVSHSLESTRLQPPKALVSFFADTQFDIPILIHLLKVYKDSKIKPAVVIPSPSTLLTNDKHAENFVSMSLKTRNDLDKVEMYLGDHILNLCQQVVFNNFEVFLVNDFEAFSNEALRNDSFDLIVFVGFNTLPCFFSSHLVVFACDDFTFGENLTAHPSYILCQQADVILCAQIASDETEKRLNALGSAKVVPIGVSFSGKNQSCYRDRPCLLVDDGYPTHQCNAAKSISLYLANHFLMKPVQIEGNEMPAVVSNSPIYSEPTDKHWPALIAPDSATNWTHLCESVINPMTGFDVIVSSTLKPLNVSGLKPERVLMQFNFTLDFSQINIDLLSLPPGAFVKQRRR